MKNTVRAKYDRNMDTALFSGLAGVTELIRLPVWDYYDFGIMAFISSLYIKSAAQAFKYLRELQPIRKRAIKIKKFVKLQKKLQEKAAKQI